MANKKPIVRTNGVFEQIQAGDALENVVYATSTLGPDNSLMRSDGTVRSIQSGATTLADDGTMETYSASGNPRILIDAPSYNNIIVGTPEVGQSITTGITNVMIGRRCGEDLTEGTSNVLMGSFAGRNITTGDFNVGMGPFTVASSLTGDSNLGIGSTALFSTTGAQNVGIGRSAGYALTTGSDNVVIGAFAGNTGQTAGVSDCTIIGPGARTSGSDAIAIGHDVSAAANATVIGNSSTTDVSIRGILEQTSDPSVNDQLYQLDDGVVRVSGESGAAFQLPTYSDGTRPAAGNTGRVIFNTTDGQMNIDDGTNWTLPDGTTT